ncbi:hypothetical protein GCM10020220_051100 [Nonomuraea rubra]|uniref:hypothetical protein n=1 Tax=Nonomuraea rubra TaxID=46180 RepID=UPI0031F107A8
MIVDKKKEEKTNKKKDLRASEARLCRMPIRKGNKGNNITKIPVTKTKFLLSYAVTKISPVILWARSRARLNTMKQMPQLTLLFVELVYTRWAIAALAWHHSMQAARVAICVTYDPSTALCRA